MEATADHYVLSDREHEQIRQDIRAEYLAGTSAQQKPRAIILAGQPGAGKSGLSAAARDELKPRGGVVTVDTDALRANHPDYLPLMQRNDRYAADRVQKDAGQWADELTEDAVDGRRNIIIDGTLKNPEKAETLCRNLRRQGYEVEVHALAVAREDSLQGVHGRYERPKSQGEPGRWVPEHIHDQAYDGLPRSLQRLETSGGVEPDSIRGFRRDGNQLTEVYSTRGAAPAVTAERDRQRTAAELKARDWAWNAQAPSPKHDRAGIMQRIRARDPSLSEPENQRAAQLAGDARQAVVELDKQQNCSLTGRDQTADHSRSETQRRTTNLAESTPVWTSHSKQTDSAKTLSTGDRQAGKESANVWRSHSDKSLAGRKSSPQKER